MSKHLRLVGLVATLLSIFCISSLPALAAPKASAKTDNSTDSIQTVAQSYGTATSLQQGLIVQLDPKNKANITTATYKDSKKMFGVTVAAAATPVSLSSGTNAQQAYAVTSGRYNVLLTTQNGPIAAGDYVSISAIDGLGMKADTTEDLVLGRAVGAFNGKDGVISSTTVKTSDGKQRKVAIGSLTVDIAIGANPLQTSGDSGVPQFVQKAAISLTGKAISAVQLYVSVLIMLVGIGVVASLLYGGIQSGMTAIGRNPLAKQSILRNMIQVIIVAVMIFIGCLIAVYLILKI